jgi:hypothetical protein
MKCIFTFKVQGTLAVTKVFPIPYHGTIYEAEIGSEGRITSIRATVSVPDRSQWPCIVQGPPHKFSNVVPPALAFIQLQLRVVQGILSFYGVEKIEVGNPSVEWKAESDEEKSALMIDSFSVGKANPQIIPIPFDLVGTAFLISEELLHFEKPLNFYRHGLVDLSEERYIDSVYDFYYVLELLYAKGKSSKKGVVTGFLRSSALKEAIQRSKNEPHYGLFDPEFLTRYQQFFAQSLNDIYASLFDWRGKVHHAKGSHSDDWHPDHQLPYRFEALVFVSIAFNVLFPEVIKRLSQQDVVSKYRDIVAVHGLQP